MKSYSQSFEKLLTIISEKLLTITKVPFLWGLWHKGKIKPIKTYFIYINLNCLVNKKIKL